MSTELDRAWYAINALDGYTDPKDPFDRGHNLAIKHALQIIERLGGKDPLARAAEQRERKEMLPRFVSCSKGPHPRPSYHRQAGDNPKERTLR